MRPRLLLSLAFIAGVSGAARAGDPAYLDVAERSGHARVLIATEDKIGYSAVLSGARLSIDFDRALEGDFSAPVGVASSFFLAAHHRNDTKRLEFTVPDGARLFSAQSDGLIALDIYLPSYRGFARSLISERDLTRSRTRVFFANRAPSLSAFRRQESFAEGPQEALHAAALQVNEDVIEKIETADAEIFIRPGVDHETWRRRAGEFGFASLEDKLVTGLAAAPENHAAARDLIDFYMAHGLYAEALALITARDPDSKQAELTLLAGVCAYEMGRWAETVAILDAENVRNQKAASPWRAMALTKLGAFQEAAAAFETVQSEAISDDNAVDYFLLKAAANAAIARPDEARAALAAMRRQHVSEDQRAARSLIEARMLALEGNEQTAQTVYTRVASNALAPASQIVALEGLRLQYQAGAPGARETLEALETLMLAWRGGAFERDALAFKAQLFDSLGDTAGAFETRRRLADKFAVSDAAKAALQKMSDDLLTLFDDADLSPMTAANLFYENIDLAPPGREGDALIRKAADQLAALDLLDQAAELLRHQAFKRLRGAERSKTAADLAALYLADERPGEALRALRSSRFARLPNALNDRRRWLEARALIATNAAPAALELLNSDESREAEALRGDIYWAAHEWRKAGDAYAVSLAGGEGAKLNSAQTNRAIKAASAFALADDKTSLNTFAAAMKDRIDDEQARRILEDIAADDLGGDPETFLAAYRSYFGDSGSGA